MKLCIRHKNHITIWSAIMLLAYLASSHAENISPYPNPPPQPGDETWAFIDDLKTPMWSEHLAWEKRDALPGEVDISGGIRVRAKFPDKESLLQTAYTDLDDFCKAAGISVDGSYIVETLKRKMPEFEAYRINITSTKCSIEAADTEGIRRGIFKLQELLMERYTPCLPIGSIEQKPFIKSRISRCFFGPIKRPPRLRDELMDDVDYYPDQYLNRLAHEGINGLWLTVAFEDLCPSSFAPEYGKDAARRFAKLRRTVEQCRRYGIKTYIFTIEPRAWPKDSPVIKRHPEMGGILAGPTWSFCPWSETSQHYLYHATHHIFTEVPNLGGMINISHGERRTSCQSCIASTSNQRTKCPTCAHKEPWENIYKVLEPMAKGMHDANPEAKFIAWFYMPQNQQPGEWVFTLPAHCPPHVTMQFNFESGVTREVLGRGRSGADYWISTPGPSRRYEQLAATARDHGTPFSAKIQTGCSHEVASIPFVPAPGLLHRKFRAMHQLGVSDVMLCWYFGNYPGIMNQAAGALSFEPFTECESEFTLKLVKPLWGKHANQVAEAMQLFTKGYSHYPLITEFQYWGPMHDGVVWPLHLHPRNLRMAPTWQISYTAGAQMGTPFPPSGDRIGEALGQEYTLAECIEECRAICEYWDKGVKILHAVESDPLLHSERRKDIGVARALGIQFRSGLNILRFYDLRERMVHESGKQQLAILDEMRIIAEQELRNGRELVWLCERDSRLGFHSEAEGYKYFPAKIKWRMQCLQDMLKKEMPELEKNIRAGKDMFAQYSGRDPGQDVVNSFYLNMDLDTDKNIVPKLPIGHSWQQCEKPTPHTRFPTGFKWTICHDREAFYLVYTDAKKSDRIRLTCEPRRLWLCMNYGVLGSGEKQQYFLNKYDTFATECSSGWQGWIRIPFASIHNDRESLAPLRINVIHTSQGGERSWLERKPWAHRLRLNPENPNNLGWLFFDQQPSKYQKYE